LTYETAGLSVRLGVLPADVNGDGVAQAADTTHLIDILAGAAPPRPVWSMDIDRSESVTPADALDAIDLLNGAGLYDAHLGASLP
jgi:hypothetical protein